MIRFGSFRNWKKNSAKYTCKYENLSIYHCEVNFASVGTVNYLQNFVDTYTNEYLYFGEYNTPKMSNLNKNFNLKIICRILLDNK